MQHGFPKALLNALVCQKDGRELSLSQVAGTEVHVEEGELSCACGERYRIQKGILDIIGEAGINDSLIEAERHARDTQARDYDRRLSVRYQKEVPSTLQALGDINGKRIIEYGCGTGRLTTELLSAQMILASDISPVSLSILKSKLEPLALVGLVLADATTFRTKKDFFDIALAAQVLEHIPTKDQRFRFFANVRNTLRAGGRFVATVYHQDLRRRLTRMSAEGLHPGGIFFHYFRAGELKEEVKPCFKIARVGYIDTTLPLEARLKLSAAVSGALSRLASRILLLREFAHLLVIKAER